MRRNRELRNKNFVENKQKKGGRRKFPRYRINQEGISIRFNAGIKVEPPWRSYVSLELSLVFLAAGFMAPLVATSFPSPSSVIASISRLGYNSCSSAVRASTCHANQLSFK